MRTFWISFTTAVCAGSALIYPTIAHHLHESTVRQCIMHEWPEHQAEAHLRFCQEYLKENN